MQIFVGADFAGHEAMAVEHGRIVAIGPRAEMPAGKTTDLGGGHVVPGFNDAHVHVYKVGHLLTSMLDLRGLESIAALQARLRSASGDGWLQGRGFNEAAMAERRVPTRHDLDAAVPHRPVFLTRTCGHIAVANTKALELAHITRHTQAPHGGAIVHGGDGEPDGILHETAMGLVGARIPLPSAREYEAMILAAAARHLRMGITSATDAGVTPDILAVYRDLDARGALPYRVNVMALRRPLGSDATLPLPERYVSDRLRIDTVKLIADGGLSGATAAMREPYRHDGSRGLLRLDADGCVALACDAVEAGLRVAVHAIGDAAIDETLDAFERLRTCTARLNADTHPDAHAPSLAPRLEHFGLPDARQIARACVLGAVAVPQPIFIRSLGINFRAYLPDPMLSRAYPIKSMLAAGLPVALSSDAPVVADESPLLGMQAALLRRDDEGVEIARAEAITARQALDGYTRGGAVASGDDDNRGRLVPGMWADFVLLGDSPLTCDPEAMAAIEVRGTWVGGVLSPS